MKLTFKARDNTKKCLKENTVLGILAIFLTKGKDEVMEKKGGRISFVKSFWSSTTKLLSLFIALRTPTL